MLTPVVTDRAEWVETTVLRHLHNPYSDAALDEPRQHIIDMGDLDMTDLPAEPLYNDVIKRPGEGFDPDLHAGPYQEGHELFLEAAELLLGKDLEQARVDFGHASSPLGRNHRLHTLGTPHIDGAFPQEGFLHSLRLHFMGVAISDVPTAIVQGGYRREDFRGAVFGPAGEIDEYIYKPRDRSAIEHAEEIPIRRLLIMGPAVVHFAQTATKEIPRRHLLRWWLYL